MALFPRADDFFGQIVIGIDEAGRGPLAGPVVAAGVVLNPTHHISGLKDSKELKESVREDLYQEIMAHALFVSVKEADAKTIDRINILNATLLAMKQVISECTERLPLDVALIDGNATVPGLTVRQIAWVKGDSEVPCIMAASIIAKVHRDRLMKSYDNAFPGYGFLRHKGYGTKDHLDAIKTLGPCEIHRRSFAPFKDQVVGQLL